MQHGDNDMPHFYRRRYPATWTSNIDKQHGHETCTVNLQEVFFVVAIVSPKFNVLMKSKNSPVVSRNFSQISLNSESEISRSEMLLATLPSSCGLREQKLRLRTCSCGATFL